MVAVKGPCFVFHVAHENLVGRRWAGVLSLSIYGGGVSFSV